MRTEFDNMRLSDFTDPDMESFITSFNNHVRVMRNHDMGLVARDEDVLFRPGTCRKKFLPQRLTA